MPRFSGDPVQRVSPSSGVVWAAGRSAGAHAVEWSTDRASRQAAGGLRRCPDGNDSLPACGLKAFPRREHLRSVRLAESLPRRPSAAPPSWVISYAPADGDHWRFHLVGRPRWAGAGDRRNARRDAYIRDSWHRHDFFIHNGDTTLAMADRGRAEDAQRRALAAIS